MSNIVKISKLKRKAKSHVGVLSFLLVAAIACFFLTSPVFSIESVTVSGNGKIPSEELVDFTRKYMRMLPDVPFILETPADSLIDDYKYLKQFC